MLPDESQVDVSFRAFLKWGTSALFDMQIFNLGVISYLRQTSAKALSMSEK